MQRHQASLHCAHRLPGNPQTGSLLTLAGSGSCTRARGVSSIRWGTRGWGTTRSIQPSIPLPVGSKEGSLAGERPAAVVHAPQGILGAPAAHAVPRAAQKGPVHPSISTSCLGNAVLQHSQTKPSSTPDASLLSGANYTLYFKLTGSVKLAFPKCNCLLRVFFAQRSVAGVAQEVLVKP